MNFETIEVNGWDAAIMGMRNPLESWDKIDSYKANGKIRLGKNDLSLMTRLVKAGSEHRKFLRYIHVQFNMTAPLYIWKEFDTYKIGTVANSTSTMHKLASTPITLDCFEIDDFDEEWFKSTGTEPTCDTWIEDNLIYFLEYLRSKYLETKDVRYWKELIRWLPESWLQTRTIDLNYEVLRTIVRQRKGHKLSEWKTFIDWVHTLPYADELIFSDEAIVEDANDLREFKTAYNQLCKVSNDCPTWEDINTLVEKYLI